MSTRPLEPAELLELSRLASAGLDSAVPHLLLPVVHLALGVVAMAMVDPALFIFSPPILYVVVRRRVWPAVGEAGGEGGRQARPQGGGGRPSEMIQSLAIGEQRSPQRR